MKLNHLRKQTAGALFAFAFILGIGIASNATVNAQYPNNNQNQQDRDRDYRDQRRHDRDNDNNRNGRGRNNDGYGNYGGSPQLRQTALNAGANDGNKAGREDRNHRKPFEYRDKSAFQKATHDYSSRLGDKETFRQYYREAFSHGYSDGYRGY